MARADSKTLAVTSSLLTTVGVTRFVSNSIVQPIASAVLRTICAKRSSTVLRTSKSKVRIVPNSSAVCGMTLKVVPEWIEVTLTTQDFNGGTLRDVIVCKAVTSCAAATIGQ